MKLFNFILLTLSIATSQIDANVKVFINNSSKNFLVRVYDNLNHVIGVNMAPGGVYDVFIKGDRIEKIIIEDQKLNSKSLSSMARHVLYKEKYPINDNMTYIIHKDYSVKMYKGTTSRDETLRQIDESYLQQGQLPTIELSIHTTQTEQPWATQNVIYGLKHKTSLLDAIESVFQ